jgi:hypothetical protein
MQLLDIELGCQLIGRAEIGNFKKCIVVLLKGDAMLFQLVG